MNATAKIDTEPALEPHIPVRLRLVSTDAHSPKGTENEMSNEDQNRTDDDRVSDEGRSARRIDSILHPLDKIIVTVITALIITFLTWIGFKISEISEQMVRMATLMDGQTRQFEQYLAQFNALSARVGVVEQKLNEQGGPSDPLRPELEKIANRMASSDREIARIQERLNMQSRRND